jgi:hypothetical protein
LGDFNTKKEGEDFSSQQLGMRVFMKLAIIMGLD